MADLTHEPRLVLFFAIVITIMCNHFPRGGYTCVISRIRGFPQSSFGWLGRVGENWSVYADQVVSGITSVYADKVLHVGVYPRLYPS